MKVLKYARVLAPILALLILVSLASACSFEGTELESCGSGFSSCSSCSSCSGSDASGSDTSDADGWIDRQGTAQSTAEVTTTTTTTVAATTTTTTTTTAPVVSGADGLTALNGFSALNTSDSSVSDSYMTPQPEGTDNADATTTTTTTTTTTAATTTTTTAATTAPTTAPTTAADNGDAAQQNGEVQPEFNPFGENAQNEDTPDWVAKERILSQALHTDIAPVSFIKGETVGREGVILALGKGSLRRNFVAAAIATDGHTMCLLGDTTLTQKQMDEIAKPYKDDGRIVYTYMTDREFFVNIKGSAELKLFDLDGNRETVLADSTFEKPEWLENDIEVMDFDRFEVLKAKLYRDTYHTGLGKGFCVIADSIDIYRYLWNKHAVNKPEATYIVATSDTGDKNDDNGTTADTADNTADDSAAVNIVTTTAATTVAPPPAADDNNDSAKDETAEQPKNEAPVSISGENGICLLDGSTLDTEGAVLALGKSYVRSGNIVAVIVPDGISVCLIVDPLTTQKQIDAVAAEYKGKFVTTYAAPYSLYVSLTKGAVCKVYGDGVAYVDSAVTDGSLISAATTETLSEQSIKTITTRFNEARTKGYGDHGFLITANDKDIYRYKK